VTPSAARKPLEPRGDTDKHRENQNPPSKVGLGGTVTSSPREAFQDFKQKKIPIPSLSVLIRVHPWFQRFSFTGRNHRMASGTGPPCDGARPCPSDLRGPPLRHRRIPTESDGTPHKAG